MEESSKVIRLWRTQTRAHLDAIIPVIAATPEKIARVRAGYLVEEVSGVHPLDRQRRPSSLRLRDRRRAGRFPRQGQGQGRTRAAPGLAARTLRTPRATAGPSVSDACRRVVEHRIAHPGVYRGLAPTDAPGADLHRPGKAAIAHLAVERRAAEAG